MSIWLLKIVFILWLSGCVLSWEDVTRHIYYPQRNRGYWQTRQVILVQDQLGGPKNLFGLLTDVWETQGWSTTEECPASLGLLFLIHPRDHMQQVSDRVKPSLTKGNGGSFSLMRELAAFLLVYHNPGGSFLLLLSCLDYWPRWSIATIATTSWPLTSMSHLEGTVLPHSSRLLTFFFLFWRNPVLQRYLGSFTSSSLH